MPTKKVVEFGGQIGEPFPMEFVNTIGFRNGDIIDALVLNGTKHGGDGGRNPTEIDVNRDSPR